MRGREGRRLCCRRMERQTFRRHRVRDVIQSRTDLPPRTVRAARMNCNESLPGRGDTNAFAHDHEWQRHCPSDLGSTDPFDQEPRPRCTRGGAGSRGWVRTRGYPRPLAREPRRPARTATWGIARQPAPSLHASTRLRQRLAGKLGDSPPTHRRRRSQRPVGAMPHSRPPA